MLSPAVAATKLGHCALAAGEKGTMLELYFPLLSVWREWPY